MGIINGGDCLIGLNSKAAGHSTSHTASFENETKSIACKAPADSASSGLFHKKYVTSKSVTVDIDGIKYVGIADDATTEVDQKQFRAYWKTGASIPVILFTRGNQATPYCQGNFILKSYKETNPDGDNATFSVSLENDGEVLVDEEITDN